MTWVNLEIKQYDQNAVFILVFLTEYMIITNSFGSEIKVFSQGWSGHWHIVRIQILRRTWKIG